MGTLSTLIFGNVDFEPSEEYLSFQYRTLIVLILASAGTMATFLVLATPLKMQISGILFAALCINTCLLLLTWALLRGHKQRFFAAACVTEVCCFLVLACAMTYVPNDTLRVTWLYVNIPFVYVLLGRKAGALVTVTSLMLLVLGNDYFTAPYNPLELMGASMSLCLLALFFNDYRARSLSFYWRLQESNNQLRLLATTDALTGLVNGRTYYEQCNQWIAAGRRNRMPYAVLFIDLDHFKSINDSHGHAAGDAVLKHAGQVIRHCIRASDVAARIGGEEFSVFLPHTDAQGAQVLAEKLRHAMEQRMPEVGTQRIRITASIGIAITDDSLQSFQDLQRCADQAMYEAKAGGRNRVTLFRDGLNAPTPQVAQ